MNQVRTVAMGFLALIGGITIVYQVFVHTIGASTQYVLLCNATATIDQCEIAESVFGYDGMDGQFVIEKIVTTSGDTHVFSGTECWVKPEGSQCKDSTSNQNNTGFNQVIVPLALLLNNWALSI